MLSGIRRNRGGDEYVFIDGKALKADEAVRIELSEQDTALVPGQAEAQREQPAHRRQTGVRHALGQLEGDAFELRDDAQEAFSGGLSASMVRDRKAARRKYLAIGGLLLVVFLFSLCISTGYTGRLYTPGELVTSYAAWFRITFAQLFSPASLAVVQKEVFAACPYYYDIIDTSLDVLKYAACGLLLALSGMLYQNAFRNPIAAPSMLGISNGINLATMLLVLLFGSAAVAMSGFYYLFSYVGGVLMLALVMLGGKWISGARSFNVVNMLLMGTILSQLSRLVINYVQLNVFTESDWLAYYTLENAVGMDSVFTWVSLGLGLLVSLIPVFVFRFRLNLISFSDEETRLLGVDPNKLRLLALGCGSIMILTAQVNAGQVAMVSLVIPFVVRAFFGAEFRKQLWGNILVGALLMLVCWDISSFVSIPDFDLPIGTVVSVVALPLFVWMIALRQRSWE